VVQIVLFVINHQLFIFFNFIFFSMFIGFVIFMLKLYLDIIIGRQLDRLMPFWQPANILHSVLIFM